ncbi:MAG: DUF835 domain-containing protein [Thermoplasmata archaeon]
MDEEKRKAVLVAIYRQGFVDAIQEAGRFARQARTMTEFLLFLNSKMSVLDKECENKVPAILQLAKEIESQDEKVLKNGEKITMIEEGQSILFCEEKPAQSVDYLLHIISGKNVPALCLTRKPKEVFGSRASAFNQKSLKIVWLSKSEKDGEVESEYTPLGLLIGENISTTHDITKLTDTVQRYISENSPPVIYLEGLSYLVTQSDFTRVLKFVQWVSEQVAAYSGFLIISANPYSFEKVEFEKLKNEMSVVI